MFIYSIAIYSYVFYMIIDSIAIGRVSIIYLITLEFPIIASYEYFYIGWPLWRGVYPVERRWNAGPVDEPHHGVSSYGILVCRTQGVLGASRFDGLFIFQGASQVPKSFPPSLSRSILY